MEDFEKNMFCQTPKSHYSNQCNVNHLSLAPTVRRIPISHVLDSLKTTGQSYTFHSKQAWHQPSLSGLSIYPQSKA